MSSHGCQVKARTSEGLATRSSGQPIGVLSSGTQIASFPGESSPESIASGPASFGPPELLDPLVVAEVDEVAPAPPAPRPHAAPSQEGKTRTAAPARASDGSR